MNIKVRNGGFIHELGILDLVLKVDNTRFLRMRIECHGWYVDPEKPPFERRVISW